MQQLHSVPQAAQWLRARVTGTLHCDSRRVGAGDGFIAWPGAASDGRRHVPAALAQGAAACLVEAEGAQAFGFEAPQMAAYPQLKAATGPIAAAFFDAPSEHLDVLAVTGTNGKTSTAWWLAQALSRLPAPIPCAVVGTLGAGRPPQVEANGLTTPDPVLLQRQFRRFVDQGVLACAIEASSIGLAERRLDGTRIRVAVFTNFTQDHLDYHGSMAQYWEAKRALFDWPGLQAAVVNVDDAKGDALARALADKALALWTCSCRGEARLQALDIRHTHDGLRFSVASEGERHVLSTGLIGQYNVANLLGVIGAMRALGVPLAQAVAACGDLLPVPGRMELVSSASRLSGAGASQAANASSGGSEARVVASVGEPVVAVDYAHTPDALEHALQALRPLALERGGRLWCVFGCGGDRDNAKRPLMGAVAERLADRVVITSDNPRSEQPGEIIAQIVRGLSRPQAAQVQADRRSAIADTVAGADAADVILLAGKGHEDYQEVAGVRQPFDDRAAARSALDARGVA